MPAKKPKHRMKSSRRSRLIFENLQWRVTPGGMECPAPFAYNIPMSRIAESIELDGQRFYAWPLHMAEKEWVGRGWFVEAFEVAMRWHARREGVPIDEQMLAASIARGRSSRPYAPTEPGVTT